MLFQEISGNPARNGCRVREERQINCQPICLTRLVLETLERGVDSLFATDQHQYCRACTTNSFFHPCQKLSWTARVTRLDDRGKIFNFFVKVPNWP
jgi:hypothetical protein